MKIAELFNVSGKVAIVTGGSRGIGEMIAAGAVRVRAAEAAASAGRPTHVVSESWSTGARR